MSKIKSDKINFDKDDFIVEVEDENNGLSSKSKKRKSSQVTEEDLERNRLESEALTIINEANSKAEEILKSAQEEKEKILQEANNILNSASDEAKAKLDEADKQKEELINNSKEIIENQRAQSAKEGYEDGYKDAGQKIHEELEEKIEALNNFCNIQYEIKNKILKSASKDILSIISGISRKILLKEMDGEILEKIIKNTIALLDKKENVSIILSEKYAKLLYELQKKSLNNEIDFDFENFKQYENFDVVFNPKINDDTIIVENLKERFDASINAQLDIIIRDIFENTNGQIEDVEEYGKDET